MHCSSPDNTWKAMPTVIWLSALNTNAIIRRTWIRLSHSDLEYFFIQAFFCHLALCFIPIGVQYRKAKDIWDYFVPYHPWNLTTLKILSRIVSLPGSVSGVRRGWPNYRWSAVMELTGVLVSNNTVSWNLTPLQILSRFVGLPGFS